jgi:hypothetical protein
MLQEATGACRRRRSLRPPVIPLPGRARLHSVRGCGLALGGRSGSAPFWLAFAAMTLLAVAAWRRLTPGALAAPAG